MTSVWTVVWQNARFSILWDVSYILENATRIAEGDVPYRDFPFPYAPLTFSVQALLIRLFGRVYWHHIAYAALACGLATWLTFRLVRRFVPFAPAVALTSPLALLGIYCIFPHPFYDPDTCLVVLAVASQFSIVEDRPATPEARNSKTDIRPFLLGAACALPLIVKQNIGIAFVVAALAVFLLERRWRAAAGVVLGVGVLAATIAAICGLEPYLRWTVRFAAERRLPPLAQQLAIYDDFTLWWWLAFGLAALFVRRARWLIAVPWLWSELRLFVTGDPIEHEINFLRAWPLVIVLALAVAARRRTAFPLLIVAAIEGAFLSQSTWGSTYGIWPLLVLLLALVWRELDAPVVPAVVVALVTLHHGWLYVANQERLTYAKVAEGEAYRSTLPALRGLVVRGPWLPDFEELVTWTGRNIPPSDAILSMPGEDLFYFATGRRPRFPVLMFDRTVNPYAPREIALLAAARDVRWVIVKKRLQLNGTPMPELGTTLALLHPGFEIAAELHNYTVYRRVDHPQGYTSSGRTGPEKATNTGDPII